MQLFEYRPLATDETHIRLIRLIGRDNDEANIPEPTASTSEDVDSDSNSDSGPAAPPPDIGDIFHAPLTSVPPYIALSYVWGDPTRRHTIRFGGALAHIGDNLQAALRYLQPKGRDAPAVNVWIDALCINQSDPVEKAHQIGHMREIYGRAQAVVAWLGPSADDSDIAMRWIDQYGGQACDLGIGSRKELYLKRLLYAVDHADRLMAQNKTHEGIHEHACHLEHHHHDSSVLENDESGELERFIRDARDQLAGKTEDARRALIAMRHVCLRQYWSRVWVIQEVKQGVGITFVCGGVAVQEDHLHHALRLVRNFAQYAKFSKATHDVAPLHSLRRHDTFGPSGPPPLLRTNTDFCAESAVDLDSNQPPLSPVEQLDSTVVPTTRPILLLKARRAFGQFELAYLLRTFWGTGATDSRDHVFALLGLARDADALGIRPNYIKPFAEVFADTTAALYKAGYMDLLQYCRPLAGAKMGEESDGRPSWVPRFDLPMFRTRLQERGLVRSTKPVMSVLQPDFSAAGKHFKNACVFSTCGGSGLRTMTCPAVLLAVVGSMGSVFKGHEVGRWLQDLSNLSQSIYNPSLASSSFNVEEYRGLGYTSAAQRAELRKSNHLRAVLRTAVADQEQRQGEDKPRLSILLLDKASAALKYDRDLSSLSVEVLVARGLKTYMQQLEASAKGRRPWAGDGGLFGIGPKEMETGDLVYVLAGAAIPFVLRRDPQGKLRIIGDVYVHEKMDGQAMEGARLDTITIY